MALHQRKDRVATLAEEVRLERLHVAAIEIAPPARVAP
jgi:hypothetical protein